jgi:sugar phosphate isomerase/epimerase
MDPGSARRITLYKLRIEEQEMTPAQRIDRRQFVQGLIYGATALAAQAAIGPRSEAAELPWKMKLSGSSINFVSLPIEQACERMAALGFEAIDIWGPIFKCTHLDEVRDRLGAEGLKALLEKHRLRLFAFSVYGGGYARYAELLGQAGGGVAVHGSAGACKPDELTSHMKAFLERLKPEAELAEKHNSYVAIENHGGALLHTVDSFKAFVDLNQNPRLGIALAPYHVQAGKESVVDAIHAAGPQLLFFYAWQHAPGVGQLPGHGPADFTPWLAALAKVNYRGYVNPFLHHEPAPEETSRALDKSRDYLQACYAQALRS